MRTIQDLAIEDKINVVDLFYNDEYKITKVQLLGTKNPIYGFYINDNIDGICETNFYLYILTRNPNTHSIYRIYPFSFPVDGDELFGGILLTRTPISIPKGKNYKTLTGKTRLQFAEGYLSTTDKLNLTESMGIIDYNINYLLDTGKFITITNTNGKEYDVLAHKYPLYLWPDLEKGAALGGRYMNALYCMKDKIPEKMNHHLLVCSFNSKTYKVDMLVIKNPNNLGVISNNNYSYVYDIFVPADEEFVFKSTTSKKKIEYIKDAEKKKASRLKSKYKKKFNS